MGNLSSTKRLETTKSLKSEQYDLVIIGGGITGAGILLDAVTRGMKVALIEMQDFAAGTSSRSTKLVHGGLRYLEQFEIGLVREVGREREVVYENGPHVTTPEWMMLPFYKDGNFGPFTTNIGLRVYDYLAGVKKKERRTMLSEAEALEHEPLIKSEGLRGAGYYVEYKTDDARLTIEVLKKAVERGGDALNYVKATGFTEDEENQINGIEVVDAFTKETYQIKGKHVINAGGPWVDEVRGLNEQIEGKRLQLTKGVHLVFDHEDFPLQQAIYFDAFDGRMIFAIPRDGTTYVGTTDTAYTGEIAHPLVTVEDRDYLLKVINDLFPTVTLAVDHVRSSWAGLRPLIGAPGKKPGEISRKEEIFIAQNGLVSMAGGKLTGYRTMAAEAVDVIASKMKENEHIIYSKSVTKHLPLSGGEVEGSTGFAEYKGKQLAKWIAAGISELNADQLIQRYGRNNEILLRYYELSKIENDEERLILAQLQYAIYHEAAYKPTDFFIRRTGDLFFEMRTVEKHALLVVNHLKNLFSWDDLQTKKYHDELLVEVAEAKYAKPL